MGQSIVIFVVFWSIVCVTETSLLLKEHWQLGISVTIPSLFVSFIHYLWRVVPRRKSAGNLSPLSCLLVMRQVHGMSSKKPCLGGVILILDANIEVEICSFNEETYWRSGVNKRKSETNVHTAALGAGWKGL